MSVAVWISFLNVFSIKYGALALLVLQSTLLVILMHYSRIKEGPMYASSTVVVMMELLKFVTCLCVVAHERGGTAGLISALRREVLNPREIAHLSIPSLVYSAQNNILFYALSHLDVSTYLIRYQSKIITTALFSVLMLGTKLHWRNGSRSQS